MNKKPLTILPTNQLLQQIWDYIISRPNRRGEHKKEIVECLYLLGWKAGLRVSEAVNFDLSARTKKGLYRIEKPKGKKERYVYISPK